MPGKSQHGGRKHHHQSKKSKAKQRHTVMASPQPAVAQAPGAAIPTSVPATPERPASAPTPHPTPKAAQYPYITAELRQIGILAGIILVILIVLALVLS